MEPNELKPLRDVLPSITRFVTAINLPPLAEKEQITAYRILRNAKKNNRGDLAEQVLFEYFNDIIRQCILVVRNFNAEKDKARETFLFMREKFERITKECYGDAATLDDTCDFKLADIVQNRFINQSFNTHSEDVEMFKQVFKLGKFHIYQFTKDTFEMLLWMNQKNDVQIARNFFHSLDFDSNVAGEDEPFFTKFAKYTLARKEYISKEFEDADESKEEHDRLKDLLNEAKVLDLQPDQFERLYALPPIAVPKQLPFICSDADSKIFSVNDDSARFNPSAYNVAADACRPFDKYFRKDIDGNKVSYDKFYEGTKKQFRERLFLYVANKLRGLSKNDRTDDK